MRRHPSDLSGGAMLDETQEDLPPESIEGTSSTRGAEAIRLGLAAVPVALERLIDGKSSETLTQPSQDGGWGVVEIIPHLRDWEQITHDRVDRILNEELPQLEDVDDSLWAIEHDYGSQDPHKVFAEFREMRAQLVERLEALEPKAWQRRAHIAGRGEATLQCLLNEVHAHNTERLAEARDALA